MKKIFATSLLIVSIFAGTLGNDGFAGTGETVYAEAATIATRSLSRPQVCVAKKSGNNVKLSIGKVAGATEYKVYRATSKNGKYTCIGTTKNCVFNDKTNSNKKYYYKVKACAKSKNKKIVSPTSNVITTLPTAPKATTAPEATTAPSVTSTSSNQSFANEVLKLVNQERAKAGLSALTTNTTLQNAANKRAQETATLFSHTRPGPGGRSFSTVLADFNISYRAAGENIAEGQKTPSEVMNGWMNSSGHRANILGSQFGKVGIGVYKSPAGRYYWTQEFTN